MREFGDWFRKSAEEAGDRMAGKKPSPPAGKQAPDAGSVPVQGRGVEGGELSNVELVTGSAGTGVRTGNEDLYDSFRPGGRDL